MERAGIYDAALYLRLSRDDTDIDGICKTESNSIRSQRELLGAYVRGHEDIQIFDTYIDDGYSGADFDRPEFKRMMEDIRSRNVNCVIVKDLSRFGRDYIEAGRLIQKTFPAFCVRFIAVTDHYDSLSADEAEQGLLLPIKNFVNDSYCRDISIKVRAHQQVKRLEGKCIAAFAVYGYRKAPDDKNRLVIDEPAADVVRKIFAWKIAGLSLGAIAERLNDRGILSPMEYKKTQGMRYVSGFERDGMAKWAAVSVKRILTNRVYIGYMEQGKQEKLSYKMKKRRIRPEAEWIQVKDTHEAVISKSDFWLVQSLLASGSRKSSDTAAANLFCGILFCADCKRPMVKRVNTYRGRNTVFYICQTKNKSLGCSRHSIPEEVLKRIILSEIQVALNLTDMKEQVELWHEQAMKEQAELWHEQMIKEQIKVKREWAARQLDILREEYQKYAALKRGLAVDLTEGLLDKEEAKELQALYAKRCEELQAVIKKQEEQAGNIKDMNLSSITADVQCDGEKKQMPFGVLTRGLLVRMVSQIHVHEKRELDIFFRFSQECCQKR